MEPAFTELFPSSSSPIPSRGHYLCSVYGARLMVPAGKGLIVVVSSPGGLQHMFNVPYGVGKAAVRTKAQELGRYTTLSTVVRAVRPSSLSVPCTDRSIVWTSLHPPE